MSDNQNLCGQCGLPIAENESGVRYFGASQGHAAARCVYLWQQKHKDQSAEIERLQATGQIQRNLEAQLQGEVNNLEADNAALRQKVAELEASIPPETSFTITQCPKCQAFDALPTTPQEVKE